jgi:predicted SprT family Zn-dependent metalloprotease
MKLKTVKSIYTNLIAKNFGGVISPAHIRFTRARQIDGYYEGRANIIRFNLDDTKGIDLVTELVFHELCHQYIDQFLHVADYDNHNALFRKTYNKFHTLDFHFDKGFKL